MVAAITGVFAGGTLEGLAAAAAAAARPLLDEPIRRVASIYCEQTRQIRLLLADSGFRREQWDSVLGWRYRPGFRSRTDTISSQGLRGNRIYGPVPPKGVTRIAAFGDSFVYGNEVGDDDAWTARLERSRPDVEVLNYGVGGYGNDQALLRYEQEGAEFRPHIVMLGFVPDDLRRVVNVYRRFLSIEEPPLFKPRFQIAGGELRLLANPVVALQAYHRYLETPEEVRTVGRHDHWYEKLVYANPLYDWSATVRLGSAVWIRLKRRYVGRDRLEQGGLFNERSEAFRIQVALFERFVERARERGSRSVIVFFPDGEVAERGRVGKPPSYAPLVDTVRARGLEALDLAPGFAAAARSRSLRDFFMAGGHYSPLGNAAVAEAVENYLVPTARHRGPASP